MEKQIEHLSEALSEEELRTVVVVWNRQARGIFNPNCSRRPKSEKYFLPGRNAGERVVEADGGSI